MKPGERRRSSGPRRVPGDPIFEGFIRSLEETGMTREEMDVDVVQLVHDHLYQMLRKHWSSPGRCLAIYQLASDIPDEGTRAQVGQRKHIVVGDITLAEYSTPNAVFLRAWDAATLEPKLLKISRSGHDVDRECRAWLTLAKGVDPDAYAALKLAGPLVRFDFSTDPNITAVMLEGRTPMTKGILMPQYTGSLADLPAPLHETTVLQIGRDLQQATEHLASKRLCHCDIKCANVFLDTLGRRVVADYGCVIAFGEPFDSFTDEYMPAHIRSAVFNNTADVRVDRWLSTITLLRLLDRIDDEGNFSVADVYDAIRSCAAGELRALMLWFMQGIADDAAAPMVMMNG